VSGCRGGHGFLVAGLAEQPRAGPERDREDLQPQLVDQVMLQQRADELEAACDDDVSTGRAPPPPVFLRASASRSP
jgi:hypothetical protein